MAKDLKKDLLEVSGFSQANLYVMSQFFLFYHNSKIVQQASGKLDNANEIPQNEILQQAAVILNHNSLLTKIPWWHHQVILSKCKNEIEAIFYIQQTIENSWSRNVLQIEIESKLFKRQGKALNNFEITLPTPQSDLARETLKDPYKFDFQTLEKDMQELELEIHLTDNIIKFLLTSSLRHPN
jgi:hypothetical protein